MSNIEPVGPYIFQPEPAFWKDGTRRSRIYAISGPGTEKYIGLRFTKEEAETELAKILGEAK